MRHHLRDLGRIFDDERLLDAAVARLLLKIQSVDPGNPDPDPDPDTGGNNGGRPDRSGPAGLNRSDRLVQNERLDTERIVQDLLSIRRECRKYDEVYRIDCLRQGIDMTIARMSDRRENREAKRILRHASRQLAAIVDTYEDENAALIDEFGLEQLDLAFIDEPDLQCHNKR